MTLTVAKLNELLAGVNKNSTITVGSDDIFVFESHGNVDDHILEEYDVYHPAVHLVSMTDKCVYRPISKKNKK